MPNQRISELPESGPLYFNDVPFNSIYTESTEIGSSSDWFLMTARPKVSNEKTFLEFDEQGDFKSTYGTIISVNNLLGQILPVCSIPECNQVRDDTGKEGGQGDWKDIKLYLMEHNIIKLSHTYCPECFEKLEKEFS